MPQLTWLVTGCSSGFGEIFVSSIVARGDRVIATARNAADIAHHKSDNVAILGLDLTLSQEGIDEKVATAWETFGGIDVLVNCAGYIEGGLFETVPGDRFAAQLETNFYGPVKLTRAILPRFRQRKSGTIVHISSKAGFVGELAASAYCASKFALEGVVETLQMETASFGIRSIIIEPGHFRTRILDPKSLQNLSQPVDDYANMDKAVLSFVDGMNGAQPGDPKKAVQLILDIVRSEGLAKDKTVPRRLPLGSDALAAIRAKCIETLKACDEWEDAIKGTDY